MKEVPIVPRCVPRLGGLEVGVLEGGIRALGALALVLAPWLIGCGGHEARTLKMRTALDVGDAKGAIHAINEELEVGSSKELPKDIKEAVRRNAAA